MKLCRLIRLVNEAVLVAALSDTLLGSISAWYRNTDATATRAFVIAAKFY